MSFHQYRTANEFSCPYTANGIFPNQFGQNKQQHKCCEITLFLIQQMYACNRDISAVQDPTQSCIGFNIRKKIVETQASNYWQQNKQSSKVPDFNPGKNKR